MEKNLYTYTTGTARPSYNYIMMVIFQTCKPAYRLAPQKYCLSVKIHLECIPQTP